MSYFSSFTTSSAISNLSTRLTSLRRAITSGEEYDDPDSEECSHVSNVLRAYYTEKGRPFPPWLPPDPKGPPPTPARVIATSQLPQGGYNQAPGAGPAIARPGVGLSDLWGDSAPSSPRPIAPQTTSLRRGRAMPQPQLSVSPGSSPGQLSPRGASPGGAGSLPSQRAGSYQSGQAGVQGRPSFESAPSAQERLRARLQNGGRSSSSSSTHSAPHGPPQGDARYGSSGMSLDPTARKPVGSPATRMWGSR